MLPCQACRLISTGQLNASQRLHTLPINVLVSNVPSPGLCPGMTYLKACFPLRCFQRLSVPDVAAGLCHWHDNPFTSGPFTPVLSY